MTLDEKRQVIEVLMCTAQDPDVSLGWNLTTWEVASRLEASELVMSHSKRLWREANHDHRSHGVVCLLAAYRLIESSPTLRREWFGR